MSVRVLLLVIYHIYFVHKLDFVIIFCQLLINHISCRFRRLVTASGLQQNVPIPSVEKEINNDSSESGTTSIDDTEKQQKSLENPEEKPEISAPENPQYNKEKQYLNFMNKLGQKKVPKLPSKDKEVMERCFFNSSIQV